jgi:BTB/POZ domain
MDENQLSQPQTPAVKDASPPFNDPTSDVILRTSDDVDFHLHKVILSFGSPVFKDMFSLPQPSAKVQVGLNSESETPLISVTEDSKTMDRTMRFCYPCEHPVLETLEDVTGMLEMVQKYDMAATHKNVRRLLVAPKFLETEPLRVYLIACRYKLGDEARLAAKYALQFPMFGPYIEELEHVPASVHHHLMDYHQQCGKAAAEITRSLRWISQDSWIWFNCRYTTCGGTSSRRYNEYVTTSPWFVQFMERARDALKDRPSWRSTSAPEIMELAVRDSAKCPACCHSAFVQLSKFTATVFKNEIERVTSEVRG